VHTHTLISPIPPTNHTTPHHITHSYFPCSYDDGTERFATNNNAFFYSPFASKSDFGGMLKSYHDNAVFVENTQGQWYWCGPALVWISYSEQTDATADAYFSNIAIQLADGDVSIGQVCNSTLAPGWKGAQGYITSGGDVLPAQNMTIAAAQQLCNATPSCLGITFPSSVPNPAGPVLVYFKDHVDVGTDPSWYTYILEGRPPQGVTVIYNNTYYTPGANVTVCGYPLAQWQAMSPYNDPGSTVASLPDPATFLGAARVLLGMPPAA
jgi:hypothetical protein